MSEAQKEFTLSGERMEKRSAVSLGLALNLIRKRRSLFFLL